MYKTEKSLFCFGMGRVLTQLSLILSARGWGVSGTCKSEEKKDQLNSIDLSSYIFDSDKEIPDIYDKIKNCTHILISIPPKDEGCVVIKYYHSLFKSLKNLSWIGYVSSTSVYGDYPDQWVDEEASLNTKSQMGINRIKAENQWREIAKNTSIPLQIFRAGGIYSSSRNQVTKVISNSGEPFIKNDIKFNRIHQDDLVGVILASFKLDDGINVFNVVDDEPASTWSQIKFICKRLKLPIPESKVLGEIEISEKKRNFFNENKLVKNDLIKKKLDYQLKFPTYKEGLGYIIEQLRS